MAESALVDHRPSDTDPSVQRAAGTAARYRFVTAASLFDGHDASINIMRRILQSTGAEVIHLGHNRSVEEIVVTALDEDAHAIAVSSYQGGHVEYFKYMVDMLRERGGSAIRVFGGGGGVIIPEEMRALHAHGVARIYSPEDGRTLGLRGMIDDMIAHCGPGMHRTAPDSLDALAAGCHGALARIISAIEDGTLDPSLLSEIRKCAATATSPPVVGITGTGGSGKSSLTDELVRRLRLDRRDALRIAVLAVDPSRRKTGGALLGDRIRMNAIGHPNIYMRSLATRISGSEIPVAFADIVAATRIAGFDIVIVETSGIGQGDAGIVPFVDVPVYVMTPEFGAASQLEKIDMLDFAALVAINKFDRRGAEDALRDVSKQVQRNREAFSTPVEEMPVYGTIASRFNDDAVTALYHRLVGILRERGLVDWRDGALPVPAVRVSSHTRAIVPAGRTRYLSEIAETVREYHVRVERQVELARERQHLREARRLLEGAGESGVAGLARLEQARDAALDPDARALIESWPALVESYSGGEFVVNVREREVRTALRHMTLSGSSIPKVALPRYRDEGEILKFLMKENLPGRFPFTAGVFPFKREGEDPSRMFAGEGDAFRTNRRFRMLSAHAAAKRLSTAFDSVTLYGFDPAQRPDIYGKVGNSGVSIATLDDMKVLYGGFDLCDPATSVSMTINGPAPTILRDVPRHRDRPADGSVPERARTRAGRRGGGGRARMGARQRARHRAGGHPQGGTRARTPCIFSTEFSLKVMGDIHSGSLSTGCGTSTRCRSRATTSPRPGRTPSRSSRSPSPTASPTWRRIWRAAWTSTTSRRTSPFSSPTGWIGIHGDGRGARRISVGRDAREVRCGRTQPEAQVPHPDLGALPARAGDRLNDIRTTLQALIATYDHCNSLHTNAYDEASPPRTEDSVRRALAIQMIINKGVGTREEREPEPGRIHHRRGSPTSSKRRCSRSSIGSPSAAACSARWRRAISAAGSRTSRSSTSRRSTTARFPSSG